VDIRFESNDEFHNSIIKLASLGRYTVHKFLSAYDMAMYNMYFFLFFFLLFVIFLGQENPLLLENTTLKNIFLVL
jgi:hypothetical protein